jgi:hypothetical protein
MLTPVRMTNQVETTRGSLLNPKGTIQKRFTSGYPSKEDFQMIAGVLRKHVGYTGFRVSDSSYIKRSRV